MSRLERRQLGPGGPEMPVIALGSWNIWDRMGPADRVSLIERAVEVGAAFFDVAYYNMGPHAEASRTDLLFAEAIAAAGLSRSQYQLCGKLWLWEYPETGFAGQMQTSLERIGEDHFDTVVIGDFFADIDIAQVVRDADAEVRAGRFSSWGVNNWTADSLQLALDTAAAEDLTPPSFAQLKYGPARRSMAEGGVLRRSFRLRAVGAAGVGHLRRRHPRGQARAGAQDRSRCRGDPAGDHRRLSFSGCRGRRPRRHARPAVHRLLPGQPGRGQCALRGLEPEAAR